MLLFFSSWYFTLSASVSECAIHPLLRFGITQSFFFRGCGTARLTASVVEFDFSFSPLFAILSKYFTTPIQKPCYYVRMTEMVISDLRWLQENRSVTKAGLWERAFFSTPKNKQLFCFPWWKQQVKPWPWWVQCFLLNLQVQISRFFPTSLSFPPSCVP